MSKTYTPQSIEELWQQSSTVLQNAYNSGYIIGVEQGERLAEERIIKLLEERKNQVEHSLDRLGAMGKEYWEIQVRILEMSKAIELIKGEK